MPATTPAIPWPEQSAGGTRIFSAHDPLAPARLAAVLRSCLLRSAGRPHAPLTLLCIGTDRSTGDALGPLTGTKLQQQAIPGVEVFGTLDEPVHAANLQENLNRILARSPSPFIVAIDACLGRPESVGSITIGAGPLRPGAGVNKNLPPVGHMHITGVVNVGGFMEYLVLQSTRLNLVLKMADVIAAGIARAVHNIAPDSSPGGQLPGPR